MELRLKDGAQLFHVVDDFTDPWTQPEAVVMHHGMAKNHKLWYAWVPIVARHYRVIRFDARGMGQSSIPEPGYPWSLDNFADDLLQMLDGLDLERVHLIGETVGGSICLRFASLYPERVRSLTMCSSPVSFEGPNYLKTAESAERDGVAKGVERSITRRLDPQMVTPSFIRWYASQMSVTPAHVVAGCMRALAGKDLRPLLKNVETPTLVLAAEAYQGMGAGAGRYREAAEILPKGRLVVFPGVSGVVQHVLPVPCARVWLDFASSLETPAA